jgi:WD40 repeat protein/serine/threonine protein kinase
MLLQPDTIVHQRYRIVRQVGQGGMGAVYEAIDIRLGNTVALKQMLIGGGGFDKAFEREAQILAGLRHAALPKVTNYFTEVGGQFLVMEYIPGPTLAELLATSPTVFPTADVLRWADELLEALEYLHRQQPPIIHRDIKPQNLKLTPDGDVVLLDFGLAKGANSQHRQAMPMSSVMGYTPQYAPLEQIQGSGTDPRSDLYAVGATIYDLLTGAPPADALMRASAIVAQQSDPYLPLETRNRQVTPAVAAVIARALALNPAERPASATEMRQALRQAAQTGGAAPTFGANQTPIPPTIAPRPAEAPTLAVATSPTTPTSLSQSAPRKRGVVSFIVGIVALFILIIGATTLFVTRSLSEAIRVTPSPMIAARPTAAQPAPSGPTAPPALAGTVVPQPAAAITADNAAQLRLLARWGKGSIDDVKWSPDDTLLVVTTPLGLYVYDVETLAQLSFIEVGDISSQTIFTPDSDTIVVISGEEMTLWNARDGSLVRTIRTPGSSGSTGLGFAADGVTLLRSTYDRHIEFWSTTDGAQLRRLALEGEGFQGSDVTFSPGGRLVAASEENTVRIWNVEDGKLLHTLQGHTDRVNRFVFSPDSRMLASLASDDTIRLWNTESGAAGATIQGQFLSSATFLFSPDSQALNVVTGGTDVETRRVADGEATRKVTAPTPYAGETLLAANNQIAASVLNGAIQLWSLQDGRALRLLEEHTTAIKELAISPDGQVALVSSTGGVQLWRMRDGSLSEGAEQLESVSGITFSSDGQSLIAAVSGSVVRWQLNDGAGTGSVLDDGFVSQLAVSPDGQTLATASFENTITLRRGSDGSVIKTLEGHTDNINEVVFSPNGAVLASASNDKTIRLWNVADGALLFTLEGHAESVQRLAFSPDGKTLASIGFEQTVRLWNVDEGKLVRDVPQESFPSSVVFSPDGSVLALGSSGELHLLSLEGAQLAQLPTGSISSIDVLTFTPDGRTLISGGSDGVIRVWGVP